MKFHADRSGLGPPATTPSRAASCAPTGAAPASGTAAPVRHARAAGHGTADPARVELTLRNLGGRAQHVHGLPDGSDPAGRERRFHRLGATVRPGRIVAGFYVPAALTRPPGKSRAGNTAARSPLPGTARWQKARPGHDDRTRLYSRNSLRLSASAATSAAEMVIRNVSPSAPPHPGTHVKHQRKKLRR